MRGSLSEESTLPTSAHSIYCAAPRMEFSMCTIYYTMRFRTNFLDQTGRCALYFVIETRVYCLLEYSTARHQDVTLNFRAAEILLVTCITICIPSCRRTWMARRPWTKPRSCAEPMPWICAAHPEPFTVTVLTSLNLCQKTCDG